MENTVPPKAKFMVFDVESAGPLGEGFAVGWVVVDSDGAELASGVAHCPPTAATGNKGTGASVAENVSPHLAEPTHSKPREVRDAFWREWLRWRERGTQLVADACWPVETTFLSACVQDDVQRKAPYPLIDIRSMALALGRSDEIARLELHTQPVHDSLVHVRTSARNMVDMLC